MAPGPCSPAEVNRRDYFGRTVLHLLSASDDPAANDYFQLLLSHPSVNVNMQDRESGWTALHRALYAGNLHMALVLLERPDIDCHVRDWEGLTPFDLYNSTIEGTYPNDQNIASDGCDLFVWGTNRNYTLGLSRDNDSALPERVKLQAREPYEAGVAGSRFNRPYVRDISMSRWHTVVATNERRKNVYVCGIGSQARLGRMAQTQTRFEPLRDFSETAQTVVASSDHTLIVTTQGTVYSFGSNRMGQLGFLLEEGQGILSSSSGTKRSAATSHTGCTSLQGTIIGANGVELDLQVTPRRVLGPLKREVVLGAAASRIHSVAYTADALYTWGTNNGQLGYDRHSAPLQVQPRRVTLISAPVRQVAATEFATACLLETWDVTVLHGDAHYRIPFPTPRITSDMGMFRPRQAQPKPTIRKITCSGTTFAALSNLGDVFTFHIEHPSTTGPKVVLPRPQLAWSVRRKFSAVRDVAIGSDGALLLCTADGHVYARSQKLDVKGKTRIPKFQAIPFLQRIVRVVANETGSFAALQVPWQLPSIPVRGRSLEEDLLDLALPHACIPASLDTDPVDVSDDDSDEHDSASSQMRRYAVQARTLLDFIAESRAHYSMPVDMPSCASRGCDAALIVEHGSHWIPVHRVLLAIRIPVLSHVIWNGGGESFSHDVRVCLEEGACMVYLDAMSYVSAMFLVYYLYTDDVLPVWGVSLGFMLASQCREQGIDITHIRSELDVWAKKLGLDALFDLLQSGLVKPPRKTLHGGLAQLFDRVLTLKGGPGADIVLHLSDADVVCHSLFLRRSPMIEALLDWYHMRGDQGKQVHVDMKHMAWAVVRVGLAFLYTDAGVSAFEGCDENKTPDEFIDFVLDVLQLADEWLLDKLQLVTFSFLSPRVKPTNVAALLTDALRLNAPAFSHACMDYVACNLETLLELGSLSLLGANERMHLTQYIQAQQDRVLHRTFAKDHLLALYIKHQDYMADLDLPKPSLNLACLKVPKRYKSPRIVPVDDAPIPRSQRHNQDGDIAGTCAVPPIAAPGDESMLFAMDDVTPERTPEPVWRTVNAKPLRTPRRSLDSEPTELPVTHTSQTPYLGASDEPSRTLSSSPSSVPSPMTPKAQSTVLQMPLSARVSQKERKKQQQQQRQQQPSPAVKADSPPVWRPGSLRSRSDVWGLSPSGSSTATTTSTPSTTAAAVAAAKATGTATGAGAGSSSTPPAMSFAQIQAQQQAAISQAREQQDRPKSFAQILDEERTMQERERRERQEAEAFERWFEEESRRVQQEARRSQSRRQDTRRGARSNNRGRRRGKPNPATARIDDD